MAHTWWHIWGEIGERGAKRQAWIGPNAPEDSPGYFRVPEFKALRGKTEYTKPIPLDKLPNTPSVTGDLISEYNKTKKSATRKINVEGYGEGRLVANRQYKGKIYFYPDEANQAHNEAVAQDLSDINDITTTFTTLAGPAAALAGTRSQPTYRIRADGSKHKLTDGGKTFLQQRSLNKYKKQYERETAGMDAINITPNQSQVSTTPTSGNLASKESALQTRISQFQAGGSKSTRDLNLTTSSAQTATAQDKPYTLTTKRDYITESGMDVEAGLKWLRVEQPAMLKKLLTTGAGKKKVLNTIDQLEKQYAANKSVTLKSKIDYYKSMVATGPAMNPSDTLLYGPSTKDFTGNTKALTAHLKGFVDNWESQKHQSTHGHHFHMKTLQYSIYKRLFELKEQGIVTEGDILNTHAMLWPSGMTSGSRRSSIMSVDAVPHISTHKLELQTEGQFDTGPVEPTSTPFAAGPLIKYENGKRVKSSRPKDSSGKYIVDKDEWKLIQESGIEVNRFDVEYIKNWAGKNNNIEFGIQKLKKLKSNKKLYALTGPDSKSEIDRIREEIVNANSAAEIQAIQQSLAENITGPMTESMQRSQDYAEQIGGGDLMKYTKDLPGFHEKSTQWTEEQLLLQERKREKKERKLDRTFESWEQSWGLVKKPWVTA